MEKDQALPKLYYCETVNPRKACAAAKYVGSAVEFVRVDLAKGEQRMPEHLARNPNGKVPVLVDGEQRLWESLAIMAWLATQAGSDLWPAKDPMKQVEVLRWAAWDASSFLPRAGVFYFEHIIKPALGLGAPDEAKLAEALPAFHASASILDDQLSRHEFVTGETLTIADFCLGATLPYAEQSQLPIAEYASIRRWHDRLMELPAWREPWPKARFRTRASSQQ